MPSLSHVDKVSLQVSGAHSLVPGVERVSTEWLNSSSTGACGLFPHDPADCEFSNVGRYPLRGADLSSWQRAAEACLRQCAACSRCAYVSLSLVMGVCAWHHSCPRRLARGTYGRYRWSSFRSGAVSAALGGSRVGLDGNGLSMSASGPGLGGNGLSGPQERLPGLPTTAGGMPSLAVAQPLNRTHRPRLILVTATYSGAARLPHLTHCAYLLRSRALEGGALLWVIVEDAPAKSAAVSSFVEQQRRAGLRAIVHLCVPSAHEGVEQRAAAYTHIARDRLEGVVYIMDDDNDYAPALWDELRRVQPGRVGVLPVKLDATWYLERPMYDRQGRFHGFIAGWCYDGSHAKRLGPPAVLHRPRRLRFRCGAAPPAAAEYVGRTPRARNELSRPHGFACNQAASTAVEEAEEVEARRGSAVALCPAGG